MKLKLISATSQALYDGSDANLSSAEFRANPQPNSMLFTAGDLRGLLELEQLGFAGAPLRIAQDLGFKTSQFDGDTTFHGSKRGLQLFFIERTHSTNQRYICIFSFGESQPGRFQLIQEAVYEVIVLS